MEKVHIPISIGAWSMMGGICLMCLIAFIHSVCRHRILNNLPLAREIETEQIIIAIEV
jgi:hypothetical protein